MVVWGGKRLGRGGAPGGTLGLFGVGNAQAEGVLGVFGVENAYAEG